MVLRMCLLIFGTFLAWVQISPGAAVAEPTTSANSEAGSWSTYRGGNTRSSYLPEDIAPELELVWQYCPTQSPSPAWPLPARGSYWQELTKIASRVVDDHTFHPVVALGAVLFGSSADDSVYCLEQSTGELRWRLTTDGPVRYAPSVACNRVYVGSDDGNIYCVDMQHGKILWQRRLGPNDRRIPGNGRLISPWPLRTGIAVADGVAYAGAGLYPSQGVFVHALDAETGKPLWQQAIDYTAHGYLLISQDRLIIPTGRSTPIVLHRDEGRFLGQLQGTPGSYAVVTDQEVLSGPGNDGKLSATDVASRESLVNVPAQHICVTPERSYLLGGDQLVAVDLPRFMALSRKLKVAKSQHAKLAEQMKRQRSTRNSENREAESIEQDISELANQINELEVQRESCTLWRLATQQQGCLAAAKSLLVLGGSNTIELRDRHDGHIVQEFPLDGHALGIALAKQQVVVTTNTGSVYCFGKKTTGASANNVAADKFTDSQDTKWWEAKVAELVDQQLRLVFGSTQGYALVVGAGDEPELLEALHRQTELTVVAIDSDVALVKSLRERLFQRGVYGDRVSVHLVEPGPLPFADYFANLVVSTRGLAGKQEQRWSESELQRVLRPAGGIAWTEHDKPPRRRNALVGTGQWVHQYGNTGNTAASTDELVHWDLRLQWFGGPGPARMVDRHLRAPAPLVADGRMFVSGENSILCVDSYNGTEYWQRDVPDSQRYSMPYDCGYSTVNSEFFAMAVRDSAWLLDVRTGHVREKVSVPTADTLSATHWGYLAMQNDRLFGSIQKTTASRTVPSRDQIDRDYNNNRPIVTGTGLFSMDLASKNIRWQHEALVLNPTITLANDRMYFVASTDRSLIEHESGRILLQDLLSHGAEIVSLDAATGDVLWRKELDPYLLKCRNILYLQVQGNRLVLCGSYQRDNDSFYRVAVLDADSGDTLWTAEHAKGKPGAFGHGEQVHHPVILGDQLVCEPVIYDLESGRRISPSGKNEAWTFSRPAHSCGTMSGAGNCLFFRSGNPTVMNMAAGLSQQERFRKISPTRPGCWINIIPADGLVLIPEASASCVCHYSLQTSMAFQPIPIEPADTP